MDFIIDRTSEDVAIAQSFVNNTWNKMSNEQKEEWLRGLNSPLQSLKGFFNYTDMVRIKNNYNSIVGSSNPITTDYSMETIPNLTTMQSDFQKIKSFANAHFPHLNLVNFTDYRTIYDLPTSPNKIDYNFLNNYEHLLKNLYEYYEELGYLDMECEYNIDEHQVELDGVIYSPVHGRVSFRVPKGYLAIVEMGAISQEEFYPQSTSQFKGSGNWYTYDAVAGKNNFNIIVKGGIENGNVVAANGSSGTTIPDTGYYEKISFDCDMLKYGSATTYTATGVQSNFINVSNKVKMYCYNISDYSDDTIVTLYDENKDIIEEIALIKDTKIDLENVSYITFDTNVGTSLKYILSDGTTITSFTIQKNGTNVGTYPNVKSVEYSSANTIKVIYSSSTAANILVETTKSIADGLDISQLDTDDIEIRWRDQ